MLQIIYNLLKEFFGFKFMIGILYYDKESWVFFQLDRMRKPKVFSIYLQEKSLSKNYDNRNSRGLRLLLTCVD